MPDAKMKKYGDPMEENVHGYWLVPGPALRHAHFDERDNEVVILTPAVIRRCKFDRHKAMWCREDERDYNCAVFRDGKTDELYGQICEIEDGPDDD